MSTYRQRIHRAEHGGYVGAGASLRALAAQLLFRLAFRIAPDAALDVCCALGELARQNDTAETARTWQPGMGITVTPNGSTTWQAWPGPSGTYFSGGSSSPN